MSIGPMGLIASISTLPQALTAVAGDRASTESTRQLGKAKYELTAEMAAGIGQPDGEEHSVDERDADGRMEWKHPHEHAMAEQPAEVAEETTTTEPHRIVDPTGELGGGLDLDG